MKFRYTLALVFMLFSSAAFTMNVKMVEKITLSQEKTFIQSAASIVVSEDNIIFLTDLKAGDIKIYNNTGSLLSVWGRKGAGPNEFLMPYFSDYDKGKLAVMDFGKRTILILSRKNEFGLEIDRETFCMGLGDDICLNEDRLLVSGYKVDQKGEPYDLYIQNPKDDKIDFLLPTATKYGFDSYKAFMNEDNRTLFFRTLSRVGYCDWEGEFVYYVWQGDLKIFKINVQSKEITHFGKKTSNYVQPFVTQKMITARQQRDRNNHEKNKMSFVTGLFVYEGYLGVMYTRVYTDKDSIPASMLQFYTLDGKFLEEVEAPGYLSNTTFFRKTDGTLFSTGSEEDENEDQDGEEEKSILKYKITR